MRLVGIQRKKKNKPLIPEIYYTPKLLREIKAYRQGIYEEWVYHQKEINRFDEWALAKKKVKAEV